MAKRESRGQQVKTFKSYIPQSNLETEEQVTKVYFQASEGLFYVFLPEHIADTVQALPIYERNHGAREETLISSHVRPGWVRGARMEPVIDAFKSICRQFAELMKAQQRKKVLLFTHQANLRWMGNDRDHTFDNGFAVTCKDISFVDSPALHLTYQVLYEANGTLYHLDREGEERETMRYHSRIQDASKANRIVPWTQEREDYLARLKHNLEQLILGVRAFSKDLEGNIDLAIAGKGSMAMLAGPKPHPVTSGPDGETMIGATQVIEVPAVRERTRTRS